MLLQSRYINQREVFDENSNGFELNLNCRVFIKGTKLMYDVNLRRVVFEDQVCINISTFMLPSLFIQKS